MNDLYTNMFILLIAVVVAGAVNYENFVSEYPPDYTINPPWLGNLFPYVPYNHWPWYPWLYGTYPPLVLR